MIDPKLHYCRCGYSWRFNKWELLLLFLGLKDSFRCPCCQSLMSFRIIYHTVKTGSVNVLDESIWRRG